MPAKTEIKQDADKRQDANRMLQAAIGKHVMESLGQPSDLHKLDVRHLWKDSYRVNVLIGADAMSVRIAHSYFLVTDSDGKVITSSPKITRQYDSGRPVKAAGA